MIRLNNISAFAFALLMGALFYIPFLGGIHLFDWDEINFAESAREMISSGNFLTVQINYEAFWEKPPLFFWLQVLSVKIFGMGEFAMRFPNALCGIITLIVIYRVGERIFDEKFGFIWMMVYAGSLLPFFYFKSGIIDPWFNLFIFLGITHLAYYFIIQERRLFNISLSGAFLGLAIITKGPVAILILFIVLLVFLFFSKFRVSIRIKDILSFSFFLLMIGGSWFLLQILNGNFHIIRDFIEYQIRLFQTEDAGHGGFLLYHFVILFFGVFPASVFALPALTKSIVESYHVKSFALWMRILFWVVIILFTIVKTRIIHYSSLAYFPITFLGAQMAYRIFQDKQRFREYFRILILILSLLFAGITVGISFIGKFMDKLELEKLLNDPFTLANLQADVKWTGWESLTGVLFFIAIIISLYMIKDKRKVIITIFVSSLLFAYSSLLIFTPKIEAYSQRAAIEFFKSIKDEDAYVITLGYKSYAQYYYAEIKPKQNINASNVKWFLEGDIDKPVYIAFKIHKKDEYLKKYPFLIILYEKNGFVFAKRDVK